ncbi:hypothetical protein Asal01_02603 [Fodinibius salicampi]
MGLTLSEEPVFMGSHGNGAEIPYPEHLTGAFTGGFGEETCRSCHFDYDLNPGGGSLEITGIPAKISGKERIHIEITVEREALGAAGFQLSARYPNGQQAGSFDIAGKDRMMYSRTVPDSLEYVQHSEVATDPTEENSGSWTLTWVAPESVSGPVFFNIAANAANGDQSEFGDFIYAQEIKVHP